MVLGAQEIRGIGWLVIIPLVVGAIVGFLLFTRPLQSLLSSELKPSDVNEAPSKYLGKEITVVGCLVSVLHGESYSEVIISEKVPADSMNQMLMCLVPRDLSRRMWGEAPILPSGTKYRFIGFLVEERGIKLLVHKVEPK